MSPQGDWRVGVVVGWRKDRFQNERNGNQRKHATKKPDNGLKSHTHNIPSSLHDSCVFEQCAKCLLSTELQTHLERLQKPPETHLGKAHLTI